MAIPKKTSGKDIATLVLLVILVIMASLTMRQVDRQWKQIRSIHDRLDRQDQAQRQFANMLSSMRLTAPTSADNSEPANGGQTYSGKLPPPGERDPFARIKQARQRENYAAGDWYVNAFGSNIEKITPLVSHDAYASSIQGYILQSLATRDLETLQWNPLLAKDWTISDDGMTMTFTMRSGTCFSDGEPVSADDVIFSFNLIMNAEIECPRSRAYFSKIKSVEKAGEDQVVFTFAEPYFESFELAASMDILPEHFYGKLSPEEINTSVGLLLGSGPYRMETPDGWQPGAPLILYRNENYWGPAAPFNRVVYRIIENDVSRQQAFRNGDIDSLGATPKQFVELQKDPDFMRDTQKFRFTSSSSGYYYIAWNQGATNAPTRFADQRVREAMTYLIPRESICEEVYLGFAKPVCGPFHSRSSQVDPALKPRPYDREKGLALLADAGYSFNDRKRLLLDADGKPFSFVLTYPSGSAVWDAFMPIVRTSFQQAGIQCELRPLDWAVFGQKLKQRDFDAIGLGWTGGIETDIYQMFHSSQIADQGDNFVQYANPALDKQIDMARACVNEAKRMPMWKECHRILYNDLPYSFLWSRESTLFLKKRIQNVQRLEMDLNSSLEWYVPADLQHWTR